MTKVGTAILPVSSLYHSCNFQKKHEKAVEKKQGSRAPRGPKVSNNFESVPARRNPARGAKFDGGVAESEAAGGSLKKKLQDQSPGKKPQCAETFLRCLDRTKAEQGRKEAVELEEPHGDPQGNPDNRTGVPRRLGCTTAKQGQKEAVKPQSDPDDRTSFPRRLDRTIGPASPAASAARRLSEVGRRPSSPKAIWTIGPASPAA